MESEEEWQAGIIRERLKPDSLGLNQSGLEKTCVSWWALRHGIDCAGFHSQRLKNPVGNHPGDEDLTLSVDLSDRLPGLENSKFLWGCDEEEAADRRISECRLEPGGLLSYSTGWNESGDGLGCRKIGLQLTERGSVRDDEIPISAEDFEDGLAHRDDLSDPGGGIGEDTECAGELSHWERAGDVELESEILLEGMGAVNARCEQAGANASRFVVEGIDAEVSGEATWLDHRQNENSFPPTSSKDAESRSDRRLADPALARDDEKAAFEHDSRVVLVIVWTRPDDRRSGTLRAETNRRSMAQLNVDEFLDRFRDRAKAVKERGIPPLEGEARRIWIDSAEKDYMDYSLIGRAEWAVEDDALVLRIPLKG